MPRSSRTLQHIRRHCPSVRRSPMGCVRKNQPGPVLVSKQAAHTNNHYSISFTFRLIKVVGIEINFWADGMVNFHASICMVN